MSARRDRAHPARAPARDAVPPRPHPDDRGADPLGVALPRPILDIGSGDGHFGSILFPDGADVGLDRGSRTSPRREARGVYRLLVGADSGSDAVSPTRTSPRSSRTASSSTSRTSIGTIGEIARVLRPGGVFACTVIGDHFSEFLTDARGLAALRPRRRAPRLPRVVQPASRCTSTSTRPRSGRRASSARASRCERWRYYLSPAGRARVSPRPLREPAAPGRPKAHRPLGAVPCADRQRLLGPAARAAGSTSREPEVGSCIAFVCTRTRRSSCRMNGLDPAPREKRMRFLITGGAGFIGSNAAHRFRELGHDVVVFDSFAAAGLALQPGLARGRSHPADPVHRGATCATPRRCARALAEPYDVVLHLAGQVAVTTSIVDPVTDHEINALGTFRLLEELRRRHAGAPDQAPLLDLRLDQQGLRPPLDRRDHPRRPLGLPEPPDGRLRGTSRSPSSPPTAARRARPTSTSSTTTAASACRRSRCASRASTGPGSSAKRTRAGSHGSRSRRCSACRSRSTATASRCATCCGSTTSSRSTSRPPPARRSSPGAPTTSAAAPASACR